MFEEIKNKETSLNTKIENQQKYFKFYSKLPLIIAIIILVISFTLGIVDSAEYLWLRSELHDDFLTVLIYMAIGVVVAAIEYFIGKIAVSQKILTVLYLQKLNEEK